MASLSRLCAFHFFSSILLIIFKVSIKTPVKEILMVLPFDICYYVSKSITTYKSMQFAVLTLPGLLHIAIFGYLLLTLSKR